MMMMMTMLELETLENKKQNEPLSSKRILKFSSTMFPNVHPASSPLQNKIPNGKRASIKEIQYNEQFLLPHVYLIQWLKFILQEESSIVLIMIQRRCCSFLPVLKSIHTDKHGLAYLMIPGFA